MGHFRLLGSGSGSTDLIESGSGPATLIPSTDRRCWSSETGDEPGEREPGGVLQQQAGQPPAGQPGGQALGIHCCILQVIERYQCSCFRIFNCDIWQDRTTEQRKL